MMYFLAFLALAPGIAAACTSFDFVIVGGGPAGLLVANRLSSNPNFTVAVIEAGASALQNQNVTRLPRSIAEFSPGIGTQVDWSYHSVPQKYASNGTLSYLAGKALGGTTVINGMTYVRAEKAQIDAWEELGNDGWNWGSMWPYYLTHEAFQVPDDAQRKNGATYEESAHGYGNQVDVGFTPYLTGQGAFDILQHTTYSLGYAVNIDANDGSMPGTTTWPAMLNAAAVIREDAARAYYWPIAEARPNLHIFLNSTASKIVWDKEMKTDGDPVAIGVEILTLRNKTELVRVAKEVIIAAGSIRSPALLENSGIGNPAVLKPLGIKTTIPRSTVGSNLMDQPANGVVYSSSTNWTGYPTFATFLTASDLFREDLAAITKEVRANISDYVATIVADSTPGTTTVEIQEQLLQHQVELIFAPNSTVPLAELLWVPYETSIVCQYWNLLPLSRGSIHIDSANPSIQPAINPNFFQLPIDVYVQAAIAIRIREFFATAPLSQNVIAEITPSFATVPPNATWRDQAWSSWIKQTYSSNSHPVSTCAMMSQELGGVVDSKGKVYGTKNVRVVDASVFPTQISGHLTATVYAIAAKIADAILSHH
ncbi:alcohol oxidase [Ophiobolus disseminans]|uniref:Alcohol oxidase n=1 Tax=Ophiobolus disseminans TaxID=1469910 RepID=A0A6A7A259_9PLEO|nr:alcohol oxidase [Ophiobolus disseminans]